MSGDLSTRPRRVRARHVEWLDDRLSPRERGIVAAVGTARLLTGSQIERVAFDGLTGRSRSVKRWQVVKRLVDWRVLTALERRIGGAQRGSSGTAYALDTAGTALLHLWDAGQHDTVAARRPGVPGDRFIRHVLGVSELYVQLVEATRTGLLALDDFRAEPAAWLPDGLGGRLKPDASFSVSAGDVSDDWLAEIDLATEHLPTVRRKADTYLDFHQRGQVGVNGVMPRVLFAVPDEQRQAALQGMLERLPVPAQTLLHVVTASEAVPYVARVLRE